MTETPASDPRGPGEPDPSPASRPPTPKRGAFPTPRSEIAAAEPYSPDPYGPLPDDADPDDAEPLPDQEGDKGFERRGLSAPEDDPPPS